MLQPCLSKDSGKAHLNQFPIKAPHFHWGFYSAFLTWRSFQIHTIDLLSISDSKAHCCSRPKQPALCSQQVSDGPFTYFIILSFLPNHSHGSDGGKQCAGSSPLQTHCPVMSSNWWSMVAEGTIQHATKLHAPDLQYQSKPNSDILTGGWNKECIFQAVHWHLGILRPTTMKDPKPSLSNLGIRNLLTQPHLAKALPGKGTEPQLKRSPFFASWRWHISQKRNLIPLGLLKQEKK